MSTTYTPYHSKDVPRSSEPLLTIYAPDAVWALCAVILRLCLGCRPHTPDPPDLRACTRIEIRFPRKAINYFFRDTATQNLIFSEQERKLIGSWDTWTMNDPERIKAFARYIRRGTYKGTLRGDTFTVAQIACYKGNDLRASFRVHGMSIETESKDEFGYPGFFWDLTILDPPGIGPLRARWECTFHLYRLCNEGLSQGGPDLHWPDPNRWCDLTVDGFRRRYPDEVITRLFTCPSLRGLADVNNTGPKVSEVTSLEKPPGTWVSDYAMNSNCRADSPEDMVFLFESKPGWNQHGGPELFAFDHHDPRGGLVRLHSAGVRLIHTEEELKQLRWK